MFPHSPPDAYVEPSPRWVRVQAGGTEIASSRRALLLSWYGPGRLPTYCLPGEDVRTALFSPHPGPATAFDVYAGGVVVESGAILLADLAPPLDAANGLWTFTWDAGLQWYEEALEVHVHARDPHKRVDVVPSTRRIRIEIGGTVVADSDRPHALFETSLPTRWYLPMEDVRQDLLVPSDTVTCCPYKGTAAYWSAQVHGRVVPDVAWSYAQPVVECPRIAGLVAFFNERVDLYVDGELQEKPRTPWSQ